MFFTHVVSVGSSSHFLRGSWDGNLVNMGSSPFQERLRGNDGILDVAGMMYFGGYPGVVPFEQVTKK